MSQHSYNLKLSFRIKVTAKEIYKEVSSLPGYQMVAQSVVVRNLWEQGAVMFVLVAPLNRTILGEIRSSRTGQR